MIDAFLAAGLGLCPGDVITVADAEIKFPLNLVRRPHERRFCLVLSNDTICAKSPIILIAPMTSDLSHKSMAQIEFERTPQNGLRMKSRLILDQIQPILRSAIREKVGSFSDTEWEQVMSKIIWNFDRA